jgi:uncharacterized membrane protein YkvA (DUF1232 family)
MEPPPFRRTLTDEDWEHALQELSGQSPSLGKGSATEGGRSCWQRLTDAAKSLKRQVLVLYYASLDPSVGCLPKAMVWIALGYALSPLDLIPDFIPVLGTTKALAVLT